MYLDNLTLNVKTNPSCMMISNKFVFNFNLFKMDNNFIKI